MASGKKRRKPAYKTGTGGRDPRFQRLRVLPCFDEIKPRILAGHPLSRIAEWLQEEKGVLADTGHEGVVTMLRKYRDSFSDTELIKDRMPETFLKAAQRVDESLDELVELEKLYRIQMERVNIDFKLEKQFNKLLPSNTQEIRAAREILSSIAELKMDLGLNDRKLGTVDVEAKISAVIEARYGDTKIGKALADPLKRQRLIGLTKQLAKKASKPVLDVPGEEAASQ